MISQSTYYDVTLSRLAISDYSPTGDNRDTAMITQIGPFNLDQSPYGKLQFAPKHSVNGYTFPSYDTPIGMSIFRFRGKEGVDFMVNSEVDEKSLLSVTGST